MKNVLRYLMATAWVLEEGVLNNLAEIVLRHNAGIKLSDEEIAQRIKVAAPSGVKPSPDYEVQNGVAVIPVYGVISKYSAGVNDISQPEGTSVEQIRNDLRCALEDDDVDQILLRIESPGGSIEGIADLADELCAARDMKPICAFAEDMCASGAYWLGCQASEFYCNKSTAVGSIGVYTVAIDTSRAAENDGYKVHVVKAGAMKGAGTRGAPVTPEQLAETQRRIDAYYTLFIDGVARGRGITADQARMLGDGRIHIGETAKGANLIDGIATLEGTLAKLQAASRAQTQPARSGAKTKGATVMEKKAEDFRADEAKRMDAIKAAFAGDPEYALKAICAGKTLEAAQAEYCSVLQAKLNEANAKHADAIKAKDDTIKAKDEEIAKLKAAADERRPGVPGVATVKGKPAAGAPAGNDNSATAQFNAIFEENLKVCNGKRDKAMSKTIRENKDLHTQFLEEQQK